ncbi:MAG: signal peptidase I, partial [Lachnospiraceae bacterium]|nr:signal peptidase I [Lachnospiraceae bacterium]
MSEKSDKIRKEAFSWLKIVAMAFVMAIIITQVIIMKTEVVSGSMIPELEIGDHVIGNRLAYLFSDPERGDVIFFEYPLSYKELYDLDPELTYCIDRKLNDAEPRYHNESSVYVKRIIGLPGDKVEIRKGKVYINDSDTPLDEPYLNGKPKGNYGPYYVPEDCYFCLGDNRNTSSDARDWDNTVDDPSDPDYDPDRFRFVH